MTTLAHLTRAFKGGVSQAFRRRSSGDRFADRETSMGGKASSTERPVKEVNDHVEVVRRVWRRVQENETKIGELMYQYLFTENPSYRDLFVDFGQDMPKRLMSMLGRLMQYDSLEKMSLHFSGLGQLHASKGIPVDAFPRFTDCLFRAIVKVLATTPHALSEKDKESFLVVSDIIAKEIITNMKAHQSLANMSDSEEKSEERLAITPSLEIFQNCWKNKVQKGDNQKQIGLRFYLIFFGNHPQYRRLFGNNIQRQADILMKMMSMLSAKGLDKFSEDYSNIVEKHLHKGLDRKAFHSFGKAMIVAMKDVLGNQPCGFTGEEVEAMRKIYRMLSVPMINAIEAENRELMKLRKKSRFNSRNAGRAGMRRNSDPSLKIPDERELKMQSPPAPNSARAPNRIATESFPKQREAVTFSLPMRRSNSSENLPRSSSFGELVSTDLLRNLH